MRINQLSREQLSMVLARMPGSVRQAMEQFPGKVFLAGGAIRSVCYQKQLNDWDLFVHPSIAPDSVAKVAIVGEIMGTPNALEGAASDGTKVQIIMRWRFSTPEECIEAFDFSVIQAAIYFDSLTTRFYSIISEYFTGDNEYNIVRYMNPKDSSVLRSWCRLRILAAQQMNIYGPSYNRLLARVGEECPEVLINVGAYSC